MLNVQITLSATTYSEVSVFIVPRLRILFIKI